MCNYMGVWEINYFKPPPGMHWLTITICTWYSLPYRMKIPMYINTINPNVNFWILYLLNFPPSPFRIFGNRMCYCTNNPTQKSWGAFRPIPPLIAGQNYYLQGYFQHTDYIIPEIVTPFVNGIGRNNIQSIAAKYPNLPNSFFVHVRRGDYLQIPDLFVNLDNYYRKSIGKFTHATHMYVVSNDPLFCTTYSPLTTWTGTYTIIQADELTTLDTLVFMALCGYGGICANSTFSWWGGFLGIHSKEFHSEDTGNSRGSSRSNSRGSSRNNSRGSSRSSRTICLPSTWINSDMNKEVKLSYLGTILVDV